MYLIKILLSYEIKYIVGMIIIIIRTLHQQNQSLKSGLLCFKGDKMSTENDALIGYNFDMYGSSIAINKNCEIFFKIPRFVYSHG